MGFWCTGAHRELGGSAVIEAAISAGLATGLVSTPGASEGASAGGSPARAGIPSVQEADLAEVAEMHFAVANADRLSAVHRRSGGRDGLVTVAVSPLLSGDAAATTAAARRLWGELGRPNVLVGVLGCSSLLAAITAAGAAGVPLNVRGLCSAGQVLRTALAFCRGAGRRKGDAPLVCALTMDPAPLEVEVANRLSRLGEPSAAANGAGQALVVFASERLARLRVDRGVLVRLMVNEGRIARPAPELDRAQVLSAAVRLAALSRTGLDLEDAAETVTAELGAAERDAYVASLEAASRDVASQEPSVQLEHR